MTTVTAALHLLDDDQVVSFAYSNEDLVDSLTMKDVPERPEQWISLLNHHIEKRDYETLDKLIARYIMFLENRTAFMVRRLDITVNGSMMGVEVLVGGFVKWTSTSTSKTEKKSSVS